MALGKTRRQLVEELTPQELTYWIAKDRIDPIGPRRHDVNTDVLANLLVAIHTPKSKQFVPRSYVPDYRREHRRPAVQTPEEMMAAVIKANGLMGGTFE